MRRSASMSNGLAGAGMSARAVRGRNWVDQISGSWGFDRVQGGRATRAIYHVRIELASPLARFTVTSGALRDLPLVIRQLRSLVRPEAAHGSVATRRAS
jgi:hypothetical protein